MPHGLENIMYVVRNQKVMLDVDLAHLYGVTTKALNQALKRNRERFPEDFCFQLTEQEFAILRSQIVTSSWGGRRTASYAFTEYGVAMLSSVLRSKWAVKANIEIMRAFGRLRRLLISHEELARKLIALEKRYDAQFKSVFEAIREMMSPSPPPKKQLIGFGRDETR